MCFHLIRRDFLRIIGEGLGVLTLIGFIGSIRHLLIKWWHAHRLTAIALFLGILGHLLVK